MAHRGFLASLFFLGLVVSNVYGENNATLCKDIVNATAVRNASLSDFNLTVSPEKLSSHTDYKVQLDGVGNFTVLLQAVSASAPVGNWSAEKDSCDGRPLFVDYSLSNKHILTTWTSPENVTSVTIEAWSSHQKAKVSSEEDNGLLPTPTQTGLSQQEKCDKIRERLLVELISLAKKGSFIGFLPCYFHHLVTVDFPELRRVLAKR
ncbi:uncharacterized protein ACNLHF_005376, partial [Anomaloglossus baeobatrachus]